MWFICDLKHFNKTLQTNCYDIVLVWGVYSLKDMWVLIANILLNPKLTARHQGVNDL